MKPMEGTDLSEQPTRFSNRSVDGDSLPDYRQVSLEPVAPGYLPCALAGALSFWLVALAAAGIVPRLPFVPLEPSWWHLLAVAGLLLANAIFLVIDARVRGWALREHDLIYRYGAVWRKTVIVPFARIQHVEAVSGPLERQFGLMQLKCFTAGGASADLKVKGLSREDARRVRQYLLEQIRDDDADPGLEAADGHDAP